MASTFNVQIISKIYNRTQLINTYGIRRVNYEQKEKLYFVAETKGTDDFNQLRGSEKGKIRCGKIHFEVLDAGISYEMVKELKQLKRL